MAKDQQDKVIDVDPEEIMKSVELNIEPDEKLPEPEVAIAKPLPPKVESVVEDKATKALYEEFSSFLEDKVDMIPDTGVKSVLPTGIDLLDAILGGGLAIGALDIIVGQPGSGKSMLAIQALAQAQEICKDNPIFSDFSMSMSRYSNE